VLALAVACLLAGCAEGEDAPLMAASVGEPQRVYRLGVGDKLKVTVFGEPELSGQYEINAHGALPLPLVGEVPARGRPIHEFRDAVARRLAEGYLKSPRVSVEIISYRAIYVHGEVRSGGEFAYKAGLRMRDAIALAGGYSYRANLGYVLLLREGEPRQLRVPMPSDTEVLPGDNIRVPERFF
jgi:polysaccharide export outer membrane protein